MSLEAEECVRPQNCSYRYFTQSASLGLNSCQIDWDTWRGHSPACLAGLRLSSVLQVLSLHGGGHWMMQLPLSHFCSCIWPLTHIPLLTLIALIGSPSQTLSAVSYLCWVYDVPFSWDFCLTTGICRIPSHALELKKVYEFEFT